MDTIKIGNKDYTLEELRVLEKADVLGVKHDTSSATPSAQALHGYFPGNANQQGAFTAMGGRPGIFNATARTRSISRYIPVLRNPIMNELIDVMTGVTAGSGNNATSACATAPKAGDLKTARLAYTYGIMHIGTKVDDLTQMGQRVNRADVPREIYNNATVDNPFLPQVPGIDGLSNTAQRFRAAMYTLGVEIERNVSPVHWEGVAGTEDNAYRGVARQWAGLSSLIKTGHTDSVSGLAVPALDSDVVSFNTLVSSDDALGRSFVEALTDTLFGLRERAGRLGMGGVQWAIAMRPDQFRAVTEVWACTYNTYRCDGSEGNNVMRDAAAISRFRDEMFNGEYLLVAGERVPVILDDSITRDVLGNNHYKSDIYIIALSWSGMPLLYGEYFPMDNAEALEYLTGAGIPEATTTTWNNGLWRVFKRQTKACIEYDLYGKFRLILDAPFLSGRLDDVAYRSYYRQTDATPGASYYVNGGVSYR
jgi:hypothetical protein